MKAAVIKRYGDASKLQVKDLPRPKPADNEVLIRIKAAGVNPIDWRIRSGALKYIYRLHFPAILGFDLAGVVEAVGKNVQQFNPGDEVYACSPKKGGQAYAEWIAIDEAYLSLKPKTMSFKEAATVPLSAITALQALRDKGELKYRERVLIVGASGGVGMFAVQIAKILGANVSAVCSEAKVDFVTALGADEVIDYKSLSPFAGEKNYDLIFDCVGAVHPSYAKKRLTPQGIYVSTIPNLSCLIQAVLSLLSNQKVKFILLKKNKHDLDLITQYIDSHQLKTHIDSEFTLKEIAQAHQRSETKRAAGKIVISLG